VARGGESLVSAAAAIRCLSVAASRRGLATEPAFGRQPVARRGVR
jgi:hypothetical protein